MPEVIDSFAGNEDERKEKASEPILGAIRKAQDKFRDWQDTCHDIDDVYSLHGSGYGGSSADSYDWQDAKLDMFWASFEILKPAVYARAPKPAVAPLFRDNRPLHTTTAELLERVATSTFARTGIDDVMTATRDDLLFSGRGVVWLRYESDDGQKVCVEHKDRTDFIHEPARKWQEVGWVAGRAWMTRDEMKKRFTLTDDQLDTAKFTTKTDEHSEDVAQKAGVWEVWHKADGKVYWVTEGIDTLLDSDDPHLKLSGFFPCPRPAYATLRRRSLVPVPDWERYAIHFRKISDLTGRIYLLLDKVRMKGLIPAGGDIGDAVEELIRSDSDEILIPVPGAALMASGAAGNFVQWLPLAELATAIQGLITARAQLIDDFYQLSGISDIMRGATQAEETLGAQQLKSQYGSVRVRGKIDELQRVAADAVKIAAEIISDKFTAETLLDMSQMELPTRQDIKDRIKEVEKAAEAELKGLGDQAEQMAQQAAQGQQGEPVDPAQAQEQLQQAQQAIFAKYAPMLAEAQSLVPIEDVVKLLRDDRVMSFAFEIESDSTILPDEMQEKSSRNEFMGAFTQASSAMMQMAGMGPEGARLAGEMMKFVLAPYRAGRQLDGAIDAFLDAAPEMAAKMQGEGGDGLAEANKTLAEAEMAKAQAATMQAQAKSARDQADMQAKMTEIQQKSQDSQTKAQLEVEKLRQALAAEETKTALVEAQVNKLSAETAKILESIGLDARKQELAEYQAAENTQARAVDQSMKAEGAQVDREFRERGESRADRQLEQQPSPPNAGGNANMNRSG